MMAFRRVVWPLLPAATLWLLLTAVLLFAHRPWPPDETRLLAVAWEMWQRHFLLLPVLNDQAYGTQMPLLPWLLILMWKVFGVHAWCLQVLGAVFALATVAVASRIVTYLWIDQIEMPRYVPAILMGTWFWVIALGMSPEASVLSFFVSFALYGMLRAWRYSTRFGWLLFGAAGGAAVLTSGFIALAYVLPVGLLAPLWAGREHALRWRHWYMDFGSGLGVALGVVVLWGMVVSIEYGQDYALAYFVGALPTDSALYPQDLPPYAYLALLLPLLLPWSVWPLVYHRLWEIRGRRPGVGTSFVFCWVAPALLLLALFTAPQPQWLLPLLPAAAMAVTYLLINEELFDHGEDRFLVSLTPPLVVGGLVLATLAPVLSGRWVTLVGADYLFYVGLAASGVGVLTAVLPRLGWAARLVLMVSGLAMAAIHVLPPIDGVPPLLMRVPIWFGIAVIAVTLATAWTPRFHFYGRVVKIAVLNAALALALLTVADRRFFPVAAVDGPAELMVQAQARGSAIGHVGDYDGRYTYTARLLQPMDIVSPQQVGAWAAAHPDGLIVADTTPWNSPFSPLFESESIRDHVRVWSTNTLISSP